MSNDSEKSICGASCLPGLANYLGQEVSQNGTINGLAEQNNQYIVVHIYLVPGSVTTRGDLRAAIETELAKLNAIKLHDLAFAVPTVRSDEKRAAELAWDHLIFAGVPEVEDTEPKRALAGLDTWEDGDVVYLHYMGDDGICVLAAAPKGGQRLAHALQV